MLGRAAIALLRRLGPVRSSNLGGAIAEFIGPHLSVSRIADENLRRAMPALDETARRKVIRGVWNNLGRTTAELPHMKAALQRNVAGVGWELQAGDWLAEIQANHTQVLFFSGHIGNWEMILPIASALGLNVAGFYRAPSNANVDRMVQRLRTDALGPGVSMFPKGARGARAALGHVARGGSLGFLVDQKMNDGIAVPFFDRPAMTAPALAQFAIRLGCPVIPIRVLRLGPARFRLICDPPLPIVRQPADRNAVYTLTCQMNDTLERWIREDPSSWLWMHRRWPKTS